jgi:hypothetical protein
MQMRLIFITTILSIFLLLIGCAAQTNLKDYIPKSPDEKAIIKVITKMKDAWNNGDSDEFLAAFHDNGEILYVGGPARISYSKEKYAKVFSQQRDYLGDFAFTNPKITITGDKGTVRLLLKTDIARPQTKISMLKENGRWYILRADW